MNDHVAKPVDPQDLYAALIKWLPAQAAPHDRLPPPGRPEQAASLPDLTDRLNTIAGLDTVIGLNAVRGRKASYLRLLATFVRSHADVPAEISHQLAAGLLEEATRSAHTLKGAAGTLGIVAIQQAAAQLEAALHAGKPAGEIEQLLQQLDSEHQRMIPLLAEALVSQPANTSREA